MVITYLGNGSFRVQNGDFTLISNPESARFKPNVALRTIIAADALPPTDDVVYPGEYEFSGVGIRGFSVPEESTDKYLKTVFLVTWEGVRLLFLGHVSGMLSDDVIGEVGEPDVLLLPVGEHFLSGADAAKLIRRLEPAVAIPSFYKTPTEFLKSVGTKAESMDKFVFKKKDLEGVSGKVILLTPS